MRSVKTVLILVLTAAALCAASVFALAQESELSSDSFNNLLVSIQTISDWQGNVQYVGEVSGNGYIENRDAGEWIRHNERLDSIRGKDLDADTFHDQYYIEMARWDTYLREQYPNEDFTWKKETIDGELVKRAYTGMFFRFKKQKEISKIIVKDDVTFVGDYAFAFETCAEQCDLILEGPVYGIGDYAFYQAKLKTITIPVTVKSIGKEAFYGSALETVYYGGTEEQWNKIERDGTCCDHPYTVVFHADVHDWDDGKTAKEPTCTQDGETVYSCRNCDRQLVSPIRLLDHTWDEGVVKTEAAIGRDGEIVYTCLRCGKTQTAAIPGNPHVHTFTPESVRSIIQYNTIDDPDQAIQTVTDASLFCFMRCTSCGNSVCQFVLAEKVTCLHRDFSKGESDRVSGSVYRDGVWYVVFADGTEQALPMDRLPVYTGKKDCKERNSPFSEWETLIKPTCLSRGVAVSYCLDCGYVRCSGTPTDYDTVSKLHRYEDTGRKLEAFPICAGCQEIRMQKCAVCGDVRALGIPYETTHEITATLIQPATCSQNSVIRYECAICGTSMEASGYEFINPEKYHVYRHDGLESKGGCCNARQTQRDKCIFCTKTRERRVSMREYTDHNWFLFETVKEPTCTESGSGIFACVTCTSDPGTQNAIRETKTLPPTHLWDEGIVLKAPTSVRKGVLSHTCTRCGVTETEPIPILKKEVTIIVQPTDVSVHTGEKATLCVTADGEGELTYRWQYRADGKSIWVDCDGNGADTAALTVANVTTKNVKKSYRCIVTNRYGYVITDVVRVFLDGAPPAIVKQPESKAVNLYFYDTSVIFNVNAPQVSSLTYQWQYSADNGRTWKICEGENKRALQVPVTRETAALLYRCVLSYSVGSVVSDAVRVTLKNVAPEILFEPEDAVVKSGERGTFSVRVNAEAAYEWQYSANDGKTWEVCSFITADTPELEWIGVASCDNLLFRCEISNAGGTALTKSVRITVLHSRGDLDRDGEITAADARLALRASVGLEPEIQKNADAYAAADVDNDGGVTAADARLILRRSVGLEEFPPAD